MYLCVRGIVTKPVQSQESEWSCICVLGVSLPSQVSQRSCICVLGVSILCVRVSILCVRVSILPLSTILIFDFGIVLTVWYFFFSFYS